MKDGAEATLEVASATPSKIDRGSGFVHQELGVFLVSLTEYGHQRDAFLGCCAWTRQRWL